MLKVHNTVWSELNKNKLTSLVFGNESSGLDISLLDENSIIIEHSNEIDSLNLPSSLAIALYEFRKQNSWKFIYCWTN